MTHCALLHRHRLELSPQLIEVGFGVQVGAGLHKPQVLCPPGKHTHRLASGLEVRFARPLLCRCVLPCSKFWLVS